jgi:glyoxylase-like metal-dependent hydrolase (beta-lactamase superfamily II)
VLTHAHADHVGSVDALAAALPAVPLIMSARDARFLRGDKSLDAGEPIDTLRGGYVITKTQPRTLLHDGDMVGSLRAISTPGHTPGHMAFLDTRDQSLIAGDAFQTQGGVAVAGIWKWAFPLPAMATWHLPLAVASAKQLAQLAASRLAVGHGRVLEQPAEAMQQAIAEATRKVAG